MTRELPRVSDPAWLFNVAQTQTLDAALRVTYASIEQVCAADLLQVVWALPLPHLLHASEPDQSILSPDALGMLALAQFEPAYSAALDATFFPLHVRGSLAGWLLLQGVGLDSDQVADLLALAGQLGPILALHLAASAQDERLHHMQTLIEVGRTLSQSLDLDSLFEAIHAATRRVVDVSDFYLALYDQASDELELAHVWIDGERVKRQGRWRANTGLAGVVLRQRRVQHTLDYLGECSRQGVMPRSLPAMPARQNWLGIPLVANDIPVGVINISGVRTDLVYSQEQIDLLMAIGAQAAVALVNARLYRQSERQAQQLAALNHIGRTITSSLDPDRVPALIMEQVCTLLDVVEGSLLLADQASGDLLFAYANGPIGAQLLGTRISHNHGIAGYVMRTGQPIMSNQVQDDRRFSNVTDQSTGFTTKMILAVPLRDIAGIHGVIEVMNRRDDRPFNAEDRHLLEAIADQAVIALENARRFAQVDQALARRAHELAATNTMLQHNLQSLTALNALSMATATSLRNPHEIFAMTARGITEASNAQGALVLTAVGNRLHPLVEVGECEPFQPFAPICRQVMETGRPELAHSVGFSRRSVFIVPLRAPQRLLGVICAFYAAGVPKLSEQETMMLFATQAAAAVESLELFAAVRNARDAMASILASTHEGMLLLTPDSTILHANTALSYLAGLPVPHNAGLALGEWLADWQQQASYAEDECLALRNGIASVLAGGEGYIAGQLQSTHSLARSLEWAVLPVHADHDTGGALLVLRDITDAREAARLRQDLTNMIVHDLRSPLSSVMAAIDMLLKGVSGDMSGGQKTILGIAYSSSAQMLDMINTLLDISRLEAGGMPLQIALTTIDTVIERASARLATLAQDRSISIRSDIAAALPQVLIDADVMTRVIQNLLANAVTYSNRAGAVVIQATRVQHNNRSLLQIAVRDRGIGIALSDQERVFAKFGQVGESHGGSGLGLTFCKLAVEAHGGQIWLESELGVGSSFFFTLPLTDQLP